MPAERPGLAWKILGGTVMVGVLPLLVAAIVIPRTMQSAFAEISRDYLGQVAQHIASTIEMEMRRHVEATTAVSKIETLRETIRLRNLGTLAPAAIQAANEQLVSLVQSRSLEHQGLFLCDREGTVFAGALRSGDVGPYTHIDIRARAYFQQARDTGTTVVSELIRSKVQDVPIVVIAVPVHDECGAFEGLIGLSVEISHLSSFIVQQTPRQIGTPFAIDRQGMIFAHHDSSRTFGAPLSHMPGMEILASRMVRGEAGVESYRLPDRTEKMAAFAPVPLTGWSVAVSMRASQFVAASKGIQTVIIVLVLAFALVGLLVAAALSLSFEQIRQALSDVRTSNHRFKLFASAVGDVIWDLDLASGRFSLNDDQNGFLQLADRTGSSFDALTAFIPKTERAIFEQGIESCRRTGQWTGEHHILRKDGSLRYALHRVLLIKNSRGEPDHLVGRLTDITERRDTEEKLARQAALLDQTRDGIMVLDLDHTIKYWNKGAGALYGWTAEEALGRRQDELLATEIELPAELVIEKGEWFGTLQKKTRAGAVLTLDCRWTPPAGRTWRTAGDPHAGY
jgi:PAS domain-containing protein